MNANMDNERPTGGPVLFYDGDCTLCCSAVGILTKTGLLAKITATPWSDTALENTEIEARIKSEMVLWNPAEKSFKAGAYALVELLRIHRRFQLLTGLFHIPGVAPLAQLCYKTVSLNRRIISPAGRLACACDPPFSLTFRLLLWAVLLAIAVVGSIIFGASLASLHPDRSFLESGLQLTIAAGSGWALNFIVLIALLQKRYLEFVQQCLVVMAIGIFGLMPVSAIIWLGAALDIPQGILLKFAIFGVACNSALMFRSIYNRSKTLGFPKWLPWLWLVLLELAGVPLFINFRLFQ